MYCCADCKYWEPNYNMNWSNAGCQGWCINPNKCGKKFERIGKMNYMLACNEYVERENLGIIIRGDEFTYEQFKAEMLNEFN